MNFRSIADLSETVRSNLWRLPADIDIVVGIPRSGMLIASMIALYRNLPLTDLDGYLTGRQFGIGHTRRHPASTAHAIRHALVVDDSCRTGTSMLKARSQLEAQTQNSFTTCVGYGVACNNPGVDHVLEVVAEPRIFEWNFMHHPFVERACFDIDGVLCHDPTWAQNDDGERYIEFLNNAAPLFNPRRRIARLVTSRLEKYRSQTEDWLHEHGYEFSELIMLDCPDAATRRRLNMHADFKANAYRSCDSPLFIESELRQARDIARLSGKPVISIQGMMLCAPGMTVTRIHQEIKRQTLLRMLGSVLLDNRSRQAIKKMRDHFIAWGSRQVGQTPYGQPPASIVQADEPPTAKARAGTNSMQDLKLRDGDRNCEHDRPSQDDALIPRDVSRPLQAGP